MYYGTSFNKKIVFFKNSRKFSFNKMNYKVNQNCTKKDQSLGQILTQMIILLVFKTKNKKR